MQNINDRLREWRQRLGLSPVEFAARSGISQNTLKGYELGQRLPGAEALAAIAATGASINWLLTGHGDMHTGAPGVHPPTLKDRFTRWVLDPSQNTLDTDAYPATAAGSYAIMQDALWNAYRQGYVTCQADARAAIQGLAASQEK